MSLDPELLRKTYFIIQGKKIANVAEIFVF